MNINPSLTYEQVLNELEREGAAHDAVETEHRHKWLNLERETAELLQLLILCGRRRRVLEIGTSNGYSALWLAAALRRIPNARRLITIERESEKANQARLNLARLAWKSGWIFVWGMQPRWLAVWKERSMQCSLTPIALAPQSSWQFFFQNWKRM